MMTNKPLLSILGSVKRSPGIEAAESHNIKSFHEGNVLWLAPELLKGQPAERSPRSKETDVFAFGCLLLEVNISNFTWL